MFDQTYKPDQQLIYLTILGIAPHSVLADEARIQLDIAIAGFKIGAQFGSGRAQHSLVGPEMFVTWA
jgi:hypothetical protein